MTKTRSAFIMWDDPNMVSKYHGSNIPGKKIILLKISIFLLMFNFGLEPTHHMLKPEVISA